jgi:hypothetical protein
MSVGARDRALGSISCSRQAPQHRFQSKTMDLFGPHSPGTATEPAGCPCAVPTDVASSRRGQNRATGTARSKPKIRLLTRDARPGRRQWGRIRPTLTRNEIGTGGPPPGSSHGRRLLSTRCKSSYGSAQAENSTFAARGTTREAPVVTYLASAGPGWLGNTSSVPGQVPRTPPPYEPVGIELQQDPSR